MVRSTKRDLIAVKWRPSRKNSQSSQVSLTVKFALCLNFEMV